MDRSDEVKETRLMFQPTQLADFTVPHRIVMAPLTRNRAKQPGNIPWELNAEYYGQRAQAALLIAEASQVSQQGQGYLATPGIETEEQVEGWKKVTEAVHNQDGRIFLQLWHTGRISHPCFQPDNQPPVAPSAIKPEGQVFTDHGWQPYVTPRALDLDEIPGIIEQYRRAAVNAKRAGFDGVEIHGANGYLLDQFLQDCTNQRKDRYGGTVENRARLMLEVIQAILSEWDSNRVGLRLSPFNTFNGIADSNPEATFSYVVRQINEYQLAYLHLIRPSVSGDGQPCPSDSKDEFLLRHLRNLYDGHLILCGGFNPETAEEALRQDICDFVAFGRLYLANPDLPERIRLKLPLNQPDPSTFYGGDAEGYTDYPFWDEGTK